METPEQCVKSIQLSDRDTRTTRYAVFIVNFE